MFRVLTIRVFSAFHDSSVLDNAFVLVIRLSVAVCFDMMRTFRLYVTALRLVLPQSYHEPISCSHLNFETATRHCLRTVRGTELLTSTRDVFLI